MHMTTIKALIYCNVKCQVPTWYIWLLYQTFRSVLYMNIIAVVIFVFNSYIFISIVFTLPNPCFLD